MGNEIGDPAGRIIPSGNPCRWRYLAKLTENRQDWIDFSEFQIPKGVLYQLEMTRNIQCGLVPVGGNEVDRGIFQARQVDRILEFQHRSMYSKLCHRFCIFLQANRQKAETRPLVLFL